MGLDTIVAHLMTWRGQGDKASSQQTSAARSADASPPATPDSDAASKAPITVDALKAAAAQIESYLQSVDQSLQFRIDGPTGKVVMTVVDGASGKVIRQIPGDEALKLAEHFRETASALVNQRV